MRVIGQWGTQVVVEMWDRGKSQDTPALRVERAPFARNTSSAPFASSTGMYHTHASSTRGEEWERDGEEERTEDEQERGGGLYREHYV